jgi:hypothetical protein
MAWKRGEAGIMSSSAIQLLERAWTQSRLNNDALMSGSFRIGTWETCSVSDYGPLFILCEMPISG